MLRIQQTAIRAFSENVIHLAVESCLLRDIPEILSPSMVPGMSDERLTELASESDEIVALRAYLETDICKLTEGLKTCQRRSPPSRAGTSVESDPRRRKDVS